MTTHHLSDGTPVLLRPLLPEDRASVIEAFRRLSPDSRYYRFWSRREGVSEDLLQRFLNSDPGQHETWAAQDPARPAEPGYGGASYWRDPGNPDCAEVSLVVADDAQHRGVGTLLLALLWHRARHFGIQRFTGHILPDNYTVLDWFRQLGARLHYERGEFLIDVPLDETALRDTRAAQRLRARLAEFS